jgi:hypothetical protein
MNKLFIFLQSIEIQDMKKYQYYIAIDPDVEASGVCQYNGKEFQLTCLPLWEVFDLLKLDGNLILNGDFQVLVEKSKSKATWHKGGTGAAKKVGANQEIGSQIIKFCESKGINVRAIEPKGYSGINHESFNRITNWNVKSTNPEKRVAGLIAYNAFKGLI